MAQKNLQISYRTVAVFALGAMAVLPVLLLASIVRASEPASTLVVASAPQVVSYQGTVEVDGSLYNGTGFFKFAIVDTGTGDGSGNYWSNDGTANGEPAQTVPLTVADGLFNVLLGDTGVSGMTAALDDTVFSSSDTFLRIWFSEELNGPFEALAPNQRISSVPYALRASYAENGSAMVPSGAVMFFNAGSCPSGWSELTEARGRTVVGMPGSGTLLGTRGTALTDLENRNHTHSVNPGSVNSGSAGSHNHSTGNAQGVKAQGITTGGFTLFYTDSDHTHSVSNVSSHNHSVNIPNTNSSSASTADVIPYIQLLACEKE